MWIGSSLSCLELLTIKSFLDHGHEFHLWVYDEIENVLPSGTVIEDASRLIERQKIFRYEHQNQWGHGKGSVAGFSDIFRYKLLFEKGGWWVDMDVTCLRPLDFADPYVFRAHDKLPVVGNLMKCPAGSPLMKECYERALREVTADNKNWFKPIQILNDGVAEQGFGQYIAGDIAPPDQWDLISHYVYGDKPLPPEMYAIHWMNEEWRNQGLDKNEIYRDSTLGKLLQQHGLEKTATRWLRSRLFAARRAKVRRRLKQLVEKSRSVRR